MIISILAFIVAFGILVIVHEFGHFWVARKVGVHVETFSIGFGPRLFKRKWGKTDFCVSAIPLGGYVKMRGEGEEENIPKDDPTSFSNKSVKARSAVVLAGPTMNIVLSFLLMPLVFWIGKSEPTFITEPPVVERVLPNSPAEKAGFQMGDQILKINEEETPNWERLLEPLALMKPKEEVVISVLRDKQSKRLKVETEAFPKGEGVYIGIEKFFGTPPEAVVKQVLSGEPAEQAGLKAGDKVIAIHGNLVASWDDLVREVNQYEGEEIEIGVVRNEEKLSFRLAPRKDPQSNRWLIGIVGPEDMGTLPMSLRKYGFWEGIQVGFETNVKNILLTFQVLKKLVTAELSYKSLGGPVAIAYTLAKASASGLSDFIYFTAFLSIQLGILNLLPIPVLDGGHLVFYSIEAIRRRPLPLKTRLVATQVGMALLLTLVVFVTWNDLKRLIGF